MGQVLCLTGWFYLATSEETFICRNKKGRMGVKGTDWRKAEGCLVLKRYERLILR